MLTIFRSARWRERSLWAAISRLSQCLCTPPSGTARIGPPTEENTESTTNTPPTSRNSPTSSSTAARSTRSSSSPSATLPRAPKPSPRASHGRRGPRWKRSGWSTWPTPIATTRSGTGPRPRSAWSPLRRPSGSARSTPSRSGTGGATTGSAATGAGRAKPRQRPSDEKRKKEKKKCPRTERDSFCGMIWGYYCHLDFVYSEKERAQIILRGDSIWFLWIGVCVCIVLNTFLGLSLPFFISWCCLLAFTGWNLVVISVFCWLWHTWVQ